MSLFHASQRQREHSSFSYITIFNSHSIKRAVNKFYIITNRQIRLNNRNSKRRLEIELDVESKVKVKDISAFEKYLIKRFLLKEVIIKIKYEEITENNFLDEWNDVLDYLSYKHPLTKALLKNSCINLEDNKLNINLQYTGSDILYAQKIDEVLSDIIERFFSKKIKTSFIDNKNNKKKKKENDTKIENNKPKENMAVQKEVMPTQESKEQEQEEVTPLILGRNQNIKDPHVKVIDISIDSGKICLDGEIINTDSRELKSGKFLFMFDLYDGTSTITCKAFIEKEKFKEVSRKN